MHRRQTTLKRAIQFAALVSMGACQEPVSDPSATASSAGSPATALLPPAPADRACGPGGKLSARLYGALEGKLDWQAGELSCEGMPRPEGRGARLRFAGSPGDGVAPIVVILGIPDLSRGQAAAELPSNVTIIEEGISRFFSTPDLEHCWTDVSRQEPLRQHAEVYSVEGAVFCIAPLGEVNGDSSVTIERLEFTGRIDWSAS